MTRITAVVHTRNSAVTLERCLRSVLWCDAIVVSDMASEDLTRQIAGDLGAKIVSADPAPWSDELRNSVVQQVDTEWTLVLDSDEYLAEDAEGPIRDFIRSALESTSALALPRRNIFFGSFLSNDRWYPDYQVRVLRTDRVHWVARHHVGAIVDGRIERSSLEGPHIYHEAYGDLAEFASKQLQYAITDDYDRPFDPGEYVGSALRILMEKPDVDDQVRAVDLVLAWNDFYRCLFHWAAVRKEGEPLPAVLQMPPYFAMSAPLTRIDEAAGLTAITSEVELPQRRSPVRAVARRVKRLFYR